MALLTCLPANSGCLLTDTTVVVLLCVSCPTDRVVVRKGRSIDYYKVISCGCDKDTYPCLQKNDRAL